MKLTAILNVRNKRVYRYFWQVHRLANITENGDAKFCAEAGLDVEDSSKYLQIFDIEPPPPPKPARVINESKDRVVHKPLPTCMDISLATTFMAGISQAKILTNSVIFDSLPEHLLKDLDNLSPEEEEKSLNALKESHLMDSYQVKLKDTRRVQEKERNTTPPYGIPIKRKCELLLQNYLYLVENQMKREELKKSITLTNLPSQTTVQHGDRELKLTYDANCLLVSKEPLEPILNQDEVSLLDNYEHPDLFPQSPFVMYNSALKRHPIANEAFCLSGTSFVPHTIYMVNDCPNTYRYTPEGFECNSLLAAFSFTAAYAKQIYGKNFNGDLPEPVTLKLMHLDEKHFQPSVFQLNTLNLTGSKRNIFWSHPIGELYESCDFVAAKPHIEGFNSQLYSFIKNFHSS